MNDQNYDLIVIGSGPAGQKGAICAAKLRKRVAMIDRTMMMGGVCVHTGTIPSKSVREAIFQLTGIAVRTFYGTNYRGKGDVSVQDLAFRVTSIVSRETEVIRAQLKRNGITMFQGLAQFADPHTVEVQGEGGKITLRRRKHPDRMRHAPGTQRATFLSTASASSTRTSSRASTPCPGKLLWWARASSDWSTHRSWRRWAWKSR